MPLNEQTSSTFYKLTRQEDQLNNKASLPLIKKIQWLIFWIILSIGVYEWTNQIIKKDELQHFQQTDTFYLNQVNNKIKELENKDFSFFKKSWNIIGNEVLNLNETQQEIELDKIIELSNFTINEIIVTDKNGIITIIRNHNNNIAVENREERKWEKLNIKNFKFTNITSFEDLKFVKDNNLQISELTQLSEGNWEIYIVVIKQQGDNWYIFIKYRIPFLNGIFQSSKFYTDHSHIEVSSEKGELIYSNNKLQIPDENIYIVNHQITINWKTYNLKQSVDKNIIIYHRDTVIYSWWIWILFFCLFMGIIALKLHENKKLHNKNIELKKIQRHMMEYMTLLENILEYSPYITFVKDLNWNYIAWNNLFIDFFKSCRDNTEPHLENQNINLNLLLDIDKYLTDKKEKFSQVNMEDIYSDPSEFEKVIEMEQNLLKESDWKSVMEPYEIKKKFANWIERTYRIHKGLFKNNRWEVIGFLWTIIDVTDYKIAVDSANRESKAKSDFLANMSHELRTPLNAILWFSDIIKQEIYWPAWKKYKEYAIDIHNSGEHLLQLIQDILDLSKIEHNNWTLELHKQKESLYEIVEQCIYFVKEKCNQKRIKIWISIPIHAKLLCDWLRLKQVIINLLSNAIKFTPDWWEINITWILVDETTIKLEVQDNWIWISQEDLLKVKEPFFQSNSRYNKKFEWTWIWLGLCNKIVTAHGWILNIESEIWQGTKVIILLPTEQLSSIDWF